MRSVVLKRLFPIPILEKRPRKTAAISKIGSMLLLTASAACSSAPVEVMTAPEQIQEPPQATVLPRPEPVEMKPLNWEVLTPGTTTERILFAVDEEGFERLAHNQASLLRWMREAGLRLNIYEEALE